MKKLKLKVPDAYALLFILAVVFAILTYIIPAGTYERILDEATGRMVVDPNSFHYIESSPISFFGLFESVFTSFVSMAEMIFFTLVIGGAFGIIKATGAIDAGISTLVSRVQGKEKLAIPLLMFIFSLAGAVMGSAEEMLPFYPIVVSLALALGFDSITGVAIVLVGAGAGFAGAIMNPFTIGVAHGIVGLPAFSGMGFRLICYTIIVGIAMVYVYRYAAKIHKNPTLSPAYEDDIANKAMHKEIVAREFTLRHKLVLITFVIGIGGLAFGVIKLGFYFKELTAVFLIIGIAAGIIGKLNIDTIAGEFVRGMSEMVYGALLIGVAGTISVVMSEGAILDTVIHALASLIQGFAPMVSAVLMFIVQTFINFFVPSGSGQAAVSMPIMGPLADIIGMTRQSAVLAFQFGDGFTNMITPTAGFMMAGLALGGVKYNKWVKFIWPLVVIWSVLAMVLVAVSVAINYGPF